MDIHLHSDFSDGENTPEEIIITAIKLGFEVIAFTEHVRKETTWLDDFTREIERLKDTYKDNIKILSGIEAKVIDLNGNIDAKPSFFDKVDVVLAAFHKIPTNKGFIPTDQISKRRDEALHYWYRAMLAVLENPNVDIIAHPTHLLRVHKINVPKDMMIEIARKSKNYKKKFEKNLKHNLPNEQFLQILNEYDVEIVNGSDSHSVEEFERLWMEGSI